MLAILSGLVISSAVFGMEVTEEDGLTHYFKELTKSGTFPKDVEQNIRRLQLMHKAISFLSSSSIKTFNSAYGVVSVALEGPIVITAGMDDSVSLHNIKTGAFDSEYSKMPRAVAIDKGTIVVGSSDGVVTIWNVQREYQLTKIKTFQEKHRRNVTSVAKKNDLIASASLDGTVKIWNIHNDQPLHTLTYTAELNSVALNDNIVVAGATDGNAIVWDVLSGKQLYVLPHRGNVNALAINDTMILTGSESNTYVGVWNIHNGTILGRLNPVKSDGITAIAMNNDTAVIGSSFGKTIIWNIHNNTLRTFKVYHDDRQFTSVAMSGDLCAIGTSRAKNSVSVLLVDPFKGTPEDNALLWIINYATVTQADFINRAYEKTLAEKPLIIAMPEKLGEIKEGESQEQKDGRIYFSFPTHVREYLRGRFNIAK